MTQRIFCFFAVLSFVLQINAQISYGGKPRMETQPSLNEVQVPILSLEKIDNSKYIAEDMEINGKGHPYRLSVMQDVAVSNKTHGVVTTLPNGDKVWRIAIVTEGAEHTFPVFSKYDIPEGAEMFVYTPDRNFVLGSFNIENANEDGGFYTQALPGDEFIVEYYEPARVAGMGILEISQVAHGYKSFLGFEKKNKDKLLSNSSGSCEINVACSEGDGWDNQKRSVVLMYMTYGGYGYLCTGALINNTRRDKTNYLLTAYHCIEDFSSFSSIGFTFYFNAQTTTCTSTSGTRNQTLTGASKVAGNAISSTNGSDFLLLKITSQIPSSYKPYYAGWNRSATASVGCGIHHPDGDWKKISIPRTISSTTYPDYANFWVAKWRTGLANKGCVEEGSSGSPLFNANKLIIGQLHGGLSGCEHVNNSSYMVDYYGRMDKSWTGGGTSATRLSNWLDPTGTGVTSLAGMDYNETVDIELVEADNRTISIYPNPSKGEIDVDVPDMGEASYTVYDMMGRVMLQSRTVFSTNIHKINLKGLPSGAYRLEIILNGYKYVKPILINK